MMKGAVKRLLEYDPAVAGSKVKLFVLDDADSPKNIDLNKSIKNDKKSGSGKVTAFTQNQTDTHSESLQKADKTSDLVEFDQDINGRKERSSVRSPPLIMSGGVRLNSLEISN